MDEEKAMKSWKFLVLVMVACMFPSISFGYANIFECIKDSLNKPEFVQMDNYDWMNPSYRTFYKQKEKGLWNRISDRALSLFGMSKQEIWTPEKFLALLDEVTKQREDSNLKGDFIHKFTPNPGDKVFVWGDLQGAFHSFLRSLSRLKEWDVIDDDFVVRDSKYKIILNGDIPIRSPYCLETLTVALVLLKKNPQNVFYVRGDTETGSGWNYYSLKQELEFRFAGLSDEKIPGEKALNRFFNTLPLGLYLKNGEGDSARFLKIVHLGKEHSGLNERYYAKFLKKDDPGLRTHFISKNVVFSKEDVDVQIYIKGAGRGKVLMYDRGLSLFLTSKDETKWDLLSCPTDAYRHELGLKSDSFAVLNVKKDLANWTLHHYSQDFHERGDLRGRVYDARSGMALRRISFPGKTPGRLLEDNDDIPSMKIGVVNNSQNRLTSFYAAIAELNERGGIHGIYLKPMILHGGNDSVLSRKLVGDLFRKYGIDIYMMLDGASTLEGLSSLIERGEILSLFPTGITRSFLSNMKGMLGWRGFYESEMQILLEHAIRDLQLRKFSFFYKDDSLGRSCMQVVEEVLRRSGISKFQSIPHSQDSPYMSHSAEKIRENDPEAILLITSSPQAMLLLDEIGVDSVASRKIFGISSLADNAFINFMKYRGLSLIATHAVPNPYDVTVPLVAEYSRIMKGASLIRGTESFEGYLSAALLTDALKTIEGPLTKNKLFASMSRIIEQGYGGLSFYDRAPLNNIWLAENDIDWKHFVVA